MAVHKDNDEERQQRVEAVLKQMRDRQPAPEPPKTALTMPRARTAPKKKEPG